MSTFAVLAIQRDLEASSHFNLLITVHFAAIFIVGIGVASELDGIRRWWDRTSQGTHWTLGFVSAMLYFFDKYIVTAILGLLPNWVDTMASRLAMANWVTATGATGFIIIALHAPAAKRALTTAPSRFLGRISYSLYLLHPTVLLSLRFAAGNSLSKWFQLPLYVAGSLFFAWVFCIGVEERFIRLSRSVQLRRSFVTLPVKSMAQ